MREMGRSMVEMLGVLAIIGVLSIGGIMGYRIAFANDLGSKAGADPEPGIGFDPADYMECTGGGSPDDAQQGSCPDGYRCIFGRCMPSDGYCNSGLRTNHSNCSAEKPHCLNYQCVAACFDASDGNAFCKQLDPKKPFCDIKAGVCVECQSDSDCGTGYFCRSNNIDWRCTDGVSNMGYTGCYKADVIYTADKRYCMSKEILNHYDAERFCAAIGKRLIRLSDVDESGSFNSYSSGTPSSQAIVNALKADSNWSSFQGNYVWTANLCGDSCYAYGVYLSTGGVSYYGRYDFDYHALCE